MVLARVPALDHGGGLAGVGPETTLDLPPGPGLTVVAGRNGTGKSSFCGKPRSR